VGDLNTLQRLLQEYDRANRLEIDAVYAQFSPTLDDYYAEDLRIVFPERPDTDLPEVRPEIVLTRTVPGHQPRTVRAPGAPFPLFQAWEYVCGAALEAPRGRGEALWRRIDGGQVWPQPRQVGRTQQVQLALMPDDRDVLAVLAEIAALPSRPALEQK
jgi:hypothetical protein